MLRTPSPRELTKESLHPRINQAPDTTQGNAENTPNCPGVDLIQNNLMNIFQTVSNE
jgi:hypothetical protein